MKNRFYPIVIIVLGVLAYWRSFGGVFVFDDLDMVVRNSRIRHVLPAGKLELFASRPLVDLSFALNYATGKLNPADYHATNLLIHILTALLLYGVVRRTLQMESIPEAYRESADHISLGCAALWVAHPLASSAVLYISQRCESMMGMFYMLSFYAFIRWASGERSWWAVLSVAAAVAGAWSKEVIITAPVLFVAYDRIFLAPSFRQAWRKRAVFHIVLMLALVAAIAAVAPRDREHRSEKGMEFFVQTVSFPYLFTQCGVLLRYLRLAVWPHPLCFDYNWMLVTDLQEALPELLMMAGLGGIVLAGLLAVPRIAFSGLWFFIILAATSSVFPRPDCAFEFRMYLPLMAVICLVVLGGFEVVRRVSIRAPRLAMPARIAALTGLAAVAAIFTVMTSLRSAVYATPDGVWRDSLQTCPGNARAYLNLTWNMINRGEYAPVDELCRTAVSNMPDFTQIDADYLRKRIGTPEMQRLFQQVALYSQVHNNWGLALWRMGRMNEATAHFEEATRLAEGNTPPRVNLASIKFEMGMTEEAIAMLRSVTESDRRNPDARACLARALLLTGDAAGAIEQFRTALNCDAANAKVRCELAWVLATAADDAIRNEKEALALANEVVDDTSGRSVQALQTLAAAQAANGLFDAAVESMNKAISLQAGKPDPVMEQRLELYRSRKPCREGGKPRTGVLDAAIRREEGGSSE